MKVIFLGGAFWEGSRELILKNSTGVVQNAADVLQKNYIKGLIEADAVSSVDVINIPFIGAYPKRYSCIKFEPLVSHYNFGKCNVLDVGFFNLTVLKNFSRFFVAFKNILSNIDSPNQKDKEIVIACYSMHLPFLMACYLIKVFRKNIKLCIIVPDLPEFMSVRSGLVNLIYKFLARISYWVVRRSDFVVAITKQMLLKISNKNGIVIEGIANFETSPKLEKKENFFLYSGTLDNRYGICELVQAFEAADIQGFNLVICGDGDARDYLIEKSKQNRYVKYLGQISRSEVIDLQCRSSLLINPRDNKSEFTKYSFPSKIIEYMASGTPVLMYRLDGVPDEYFKYSYIIPDEPEGFARILKEISSYSIEKLTEKGAEARNFVLERKNPKQQVNKLVKLIKGEFNV